MKNFNLSLLTQSEGFSFNLGVILFITITCLIYWMVLRSAKKSNNYGIEGSKNVPKGQANAVISHIEMYGSICKTEALELYQIKNLKAVIHVIRTKHKIDIQSVSQRNGELQFRGYAFKK